MSNANAVHKEGDWRTVLVAAVASIIVGVISAWATIHAEEIKVQAQRQQLEAERREKEQAQSRVTLLAKMYEDAPQKFTRQLAGQINSAPRLITASSESSGNGADVMDHARAIVKSRNDLRSSLDDIGSRLDSEIDELEKEASKANPDPSKIAHILEVLRLSWPAKEQEIELRVRKMMTELGIVPIEVPAPSSGTPDSGGGVSR